MKPKLFIIGNSVKRCHYISNFFTNYVKYIDYETDLSSISDNDLQNYDIIIYDIDKYIKNIDNILNLQLNSINIFCINNPNEEITNKLMKLGVDMIIPYDLDEIKVKHSMLIYELITKDNYKHSNSISYNNDYLVI
jgi:hypothetical protein